MRKSRKRYGKKSKNKWNKSYLKVVILLVMLVGLGVFFSLPKVGHSQNKVAVVSSDSLDSYFPNFEWNNKKSIYLLLLHYSKNSVGEVITDRISILEVNPNDMVASILNIPPHLSLLQGTDYVEADLIYALGNLQSPPQGLKLLSLDIKQTLGIGIVGYVSTNGDYTNLLQNIDSSSLYTNFSSSSLFSLNSYLSQIGYSNIKINNINGDVEKKSNHLTIIDETSYDELLSSKMMDKQIVNEHARIEVYNATSTSGLASVLAREVSNMGGNIIRVEGISDSAPKSIIYVKNKQKYSETIFYIEKLLDNNDILSGKPAPFFHTGDIQIVVN